MIVRAYIFLIMACILWSFNPVANKIALVEIAVPQLVFMRTFLSAIIMLTVTFCMGYSFRLKQIGWRPFLVGCFRSRFDVPPFCNFAYTSECLKHCLSYGTDAILSADPRPFGFKGRGPVFNLVWGCSCFIWIISIFLRRTVNK